MNIKGKEKKNRFRCQYQKGHKICVSESIESDTIITSSQIILALAKLAVKVKKQYKSKAADKVAFKVLQIHEHIMKDIYGHINVGGRHSYYLDKRNKNKEKSSERVDVEFRGCYGTKDNSSVIEKYIKGYRKLKHWDSILDSL